LFTSQGRISYGHLGRTSLLFLRDHYTVYTCRTITCKYCIENIIRIQILFNVFNVLYFNLHIFYIYDI